MRKAVTKRFQWHLARCAVASASLLAAGAASAADSGWMGTNAPPYGYLLGTYTVADSGRNVDDGFGGQLGFGVPVLTWLSVEANLFANSFSGENGGPDLTQQALGVDFVANFGNRQAPTPFVLFGGGEVKNDADVVDDTTAYLNLGGGVVGQLSNNRRLRYRAEGRILFDSFGEDFQDFRLGLGLEVALGSFPEPPKPVAPPVERIIEVPVPAKPPADQDGDGIADAYDRCPNTLRGAEVDGYGCVVKAQIVQLQNVTFEFNSAELTPNGKSVLEPAISFLSSQPTLRAEIAGHTDSIGSDAYNKKLSRARADSVRGYLVSRGIASERLTSVGYGESSPVSTNQTDEGRALNRRVELRIEGQPQP